MTIWSQYQSVQAMILAEAARLSWDPIMLDDMARICFQRQYARLTLSQAKQMLADMQVIEPDGSHDSLKPDTPLARWLAKQA